MYFTFFTEKPYRSLLKLRVLIPCKKGESHQAFSDCIDAMNCAMLAGMTTKVSSQSEIALFVHQMIPHHQNAVNMAKTLLVTGDVPCDDLTNDDDPFCALQVILRE